MREGEGVFGMQGEIAMGLYAMRVMRCMCSVGYCTR